jgi:ABC-type multidrug transport system fused ATPase/permease subunit
LGSVKTAAQVAAIDSFITEELRDGYMTIVGERGVRLSGGQRQRIGIARALYRNPDLLVLDEATSALDSVTEEAILKSIERLSGEKTIVMIAHRLATVRKCDRIFVMDGGRLVGMGTYDELISTNEVFQKLAAVQPAD